MDVSVLIPTRQRPLRLAECVARLARQSVAPDRYEVVVAIDGTDPSSVDAAQIAWRDAGGRSGGLRVIEFDRLGYIEVRHQAVARLDGMLLVSLNDDVEPDSGFLDAHLRAHDSGEDAIVVGASPFVVWPEASAIDRLVAETSLIFFYDPMDRAVAEGDVDRDWGYRHCFGLNFSATLDSVRAVGGFASMPLTYGYDDIHLAYKLVERFAMPVRYWPAARAPHRHRFDAESILRREYTLGRAARRFACADPDFAGALFGRDVTAPDEIEYARAYVAREAADARRIEASFRAMAHVPGAAIGDDAAVLAALAQQVVLLKRHTWRRGFIAETQGDASEYATLLAPGDADLVVQSDPEGALA